MRIIEMPAGDWKEFDLKPERNRKTSADAGTLVRAVALQQPISRLLPAEEAVDNEKFRQEQANRSRFHLIQFACSFRPTDEGTFERAAIEVGLVRADNNISEMPIAWSMNPMVQEEEVELTRTVKLTGDLKISDTGIGTAVEESKKQTGHRAFLQAFGWMSPQPAWEFKSQETRAISGSYLFSMVVCCPADTAVNGSVRMSVQVRRKVLGLIPYKADFPDLRACAFELAAGSPQ